VTPSSIMLAALEGEIAVSGRHLDNIAPITLGGLVLSRSIDPIDVIALRAPENWSIALITPNVRIETKKARAILQGRYAVAIEDVRALAPPVLVHRVLPNFHAEADGLTAHALVERLVDAIRP